MEFAWALIVAFSSFGHGCDEGMLSSECFSSYKDVACISLLESSHKFRCTLLFSLVFNAEAKHSLAVLLGKLKTLGEMITSYIVRFCQDRDHNNFVFHAFLPEFLINAILRSSGIEEFQSNGHIFKSIIYVGQIFFDEVILWLW